MNPRKTPTPNPPLRIGILGCANIAKQFTRDVRQSKKVSVDAVASRNADTAAAYAATNGIARHHGSYEALLADTAIDAIYIPLPNSLHAEWAIKAAAHGKHILCEKPLALGLAEAQDMFAAARQHGVMLLEAYPWWFQPQTRDLLALLHDGTVGEVRSVQASFGFTLANPAGNIRMNPDLGGGALLDAGSYTLSMIRLVMGCAPQRVMADASWSATGVDISLMATLHYADGRRAPDDLRDGRCQPPPRHHHGQQGHGGDRVPQPHQPAAQPPLGLPAQPDAHAPWDGQQQPVCRRHIGHRQPLLVCRRGVCQGGGRQRLCRDRARRQRQPGHRRHAGSHCAQRALGAGGGCSCCLKKCALFHFQIIREVGAPTKTVLLHG